MPAKWEGLTPSERAMLVDVCELHESGPVFVGRMRPQDMAGLMVLWNGGLVDIQATKKGQDLLEKRVVPTAVGRRLVEKHKVAT